MWQRFITAAGNNGMNPISLWRYGTADPYAFGVMRDMFPEAPPPVAVAPVEQLQSPPPVPSSPDAAALQAATAPGAGLPSEKAAVSDQSQRAAAIVQNSCD
jgi:hypothetical protein